MEPARRAGGQPADPGGAAAAPQARVRMRRRRHTGEGAAAESKRRALACRMATTWTSPSVGQCRSGPAPVFEAETPRLLLESPRLQEERDRVFLREKPPRPPRGSNPAAGSCAPPRASVERRCFSGAANSGLVGCLSSAQSSSSTGVFTLDRVSADPRQAQTSLVPDFAVGLLPDRPRGGETCRALVPEIPGGAVPAEWCVRWMSETDSPGIRVVA